MDSIRSKPLFYVAVLLSLFILGGYRFGWMRFFDRASSRSFEVGERFLRGVIVSEVEERKTSYGERRAWFDLTSEIGKIRINLRHAEEPLHYGDEVALKGELQLPKGRRNPGGYDQSVSFWQRRIDAVFYADEKNAKVLRHGRGNFFRTQAIRAKRFLSQGLSTFFSERDAAFLKALFLGERSDMDESFLDLFMKTGTLHILAVSGFNIGFLLATVWALLWPFPLHRDFKLGAALVVIWAYCFLVGWQAPVVRASIMTSLFIAGRLLGRPVPILNTLGFAGLVILLVNPRQIYDVGFQLSFLAVFAIAAFLPLFVQLPELLPNERFTLKERTLYYLRGLFWVSFVCAVVTLPVTVSHFYIVTPLSLLANLVVVPVSFGLFFAGILFFLTFWWAPKFISLIPLFVKALMIAMTQTLFFLEHLPGAYFVVGKPSLVALFILTMGIVYFLFDKKISSGLARAGTLFLFCLCVFLIQDVWRMGDRSLSVTALDVGQGDAIFIEFPQGGNLLVDGGRGRDPDEGRRTLTPFLKSKGVRVLDAMLVSHPQEDHIGGLFSVFDEFRVRNVITGDWKDAKSLLRFRALAAKEPAREWQVGRGMKIDGYRNVDMNILNPGQGDVKADLNDESLVLRISYGQTSFLLTGDIEAKAMQDILSSGLPVRSTVLKVPHHGSKTNLGGREFFQTIHPLFSVISVGERNSYHHPAAETISLLKDIGSRVYRTDEDYAVSFLSDGQTIIPTTCRISSC